MSSGVFVIKKDGSLVEMQQSEYDSEDVLQKLLEQYPNLLAGDLVDESNPRKWLLVSREYGIQYNEYSGNRWSIDHLFLDQDGVPTLVEVKRSSNTQIRREVVGQMLEYAANATQYWGINRIIASFEARCEQLDSDPWEVWMNELDKTEGNYDKYWETVKTNLEICKIRLLFIADEIPLELKRIVEFLNKEMNNVEVLALEIKQFLGEDQKIMIPRIFGQTSRSKSSSNTDNLRHQKMRQFWTTLLEKMRPRTDLFINNKGTNQTRLDSTAYNTDFSYSYVTNEHKARVEIWTRSEKRYKALESKREKIEIELPFDLTWVRKPDRIISRVFTIVSDKYGWADEENWDKLQERMIKTMIKFDKALKPYIV